MLEIKSKHDTTMYDTLAKIKLSSQYGMMVRKLSESEKEIIKDAYKNAKSHVYVDTDSSQLGG